MRAPSSELVPLFFSGGHLEQLLNTEHLMMMALIHWLSDKHQIFLHLVESYIQMLVLVTGQVCLPRKLQDYIVAS